MNKELFELIEKYVNEPPQEANKYTDILESKLDSFLNSIEDENFVSCLDQENNKFEINHLESKYFVLFFKEIGYYEKQDFYLKTNTCFKFYDFLIQYLSNREKNYFKVGYISIAIVFYITYFARGTDNKTFKETYNKFISQKDTNYINDYPKFLNEVIFKIENLSNEYRENEINDYYIKDETIGIPMDKVNKTFFSNSEAKEELYKNGSALISTASLRDKKRKLKNEITTYLEIDTKSLEKFKRETGAKFSIELTIEDLLIYATVHAIAVQNKTNFVSIYSIYTYLYNNKKLGIITRQKIKDSIDKLRLTLITLDNKEESTYYKYPHFSYGSGKPDYCLPCQWGEKEGVEGIYIYQIDYGDGRGPILALPLMKFAMDRKQLEQIPRAFISCLQTRNNKSSAVEIYLVKEVIAKKMKANRDGKKLDSLEISLNDIYRNAGINFGDKNRKKNIQRLRDNVITPIIKEWIKIGALKEKSYIDLNSKKLVIYFNNKYDYEAQ